MKLQRLGFFIFIASFLISVLMPVLSKSQNWIWAKGIKGSGTDQGYSICTDAGGNVFVTGTYQSPTLTFGSTVLTNSGHSNLFIAKYDAIGNVLWAKTVGGPYDDYGLSVSADAAGNVFVTGSFSSPSITFGSTILINTIGDKAGMFLAKYDANGNVLWAKRAGGDGQQLGTAVCTDAAGNVFVTGTCEANSITFGSTTLSGPDGYFIAKYDANGNVLWAKSTGGVGSIYDGGSSLSTDAGGNVFVTGSFGNTIIFGSFILGNIGVFDLFIVKYDANGNVLWARSAGGSGIDGGTSVSTNADGDVFVTGFFASPSIAFGSTTLINAGDTDVFIAKYDANGKSLWAKNAGGTTEAIGLSVSADNMGNAFVTGGFSGPAITFGSTTINSPPGSDYPLFIVKYDANGNVLCTKSLASGGNDAVNAYDILGSRRNLDWVGISADPFGNAYLTGSFGVNPFILDADTLALRGKENVFIAKYTCTCILPATISGKDSICAGTLLTANTIGATNFLWSTGATTQSIVPNPAISNYTVTVSNGFCRDSAVSKSVKVFPIPVVSLSSPQTVCAGTPVQLDASGGDIYLWSTGAITSGITISPIITAPYEVVVSNGICSSNGSVIITVNPLPDVTACCNVTFSPGQSVPLLVSPVNASDIYSWLPAKGLSCNTCPDPIASPISTTTYTLITTNEYGCVKMETVSLKMPCDIFIPDAFSPNADGLNDFFILRTYCNEIQSMYFEIYDRWGNKVFESTDLNTVWDATYKGKQMDNAVFVYSLQATLMDGSVINKKGNITLIK